MTRQRQTSREAGAQSHGPHGRGQPGCRMSSILPDVIRGATRDSVLPHRGRSPGCRSQSLLIPAGSGPEPGPDVALGPRREWELAANANEDCPDRGRRSSISPRIEAAARRTVCAFPGCPSVHLRDNGVRPFQPATAEPPHRGSSILHVPTPLAGNVTNREGGATRALLPGIPTQGAALLDVWGSVSSSAPKPIRGDGRPDSQHGECQRGPSRRGPGLARAERRGDSLSRRTDGDLCGRLVVSPRSSLGKEDPQVMSTA